MSDGTVHLVMDGAIATVTFDRPAARNAMTWAMYESLSDICTQLRKDTSVRAVAFRGAGGEAFVAGTDIEQFKAFEGGADGVAYEDRIEACVAPLESLPVPTIAVVDGWCVGGGLVIATACDIRIGTASARFGVPIARTLGNCLSAANLARLVAAFGRPRVQRMLVGAEILGAEEARTCGFLADVVEPGKLDEASKLLCQRVAAMAPVTQAVTKEALQRLLLANLPDVRDLIELTYGSADFREGVHTFGEKRPPRWQGR